MEVFSHTVNIHAALCPDASAHDTDVTGLRRELALLRTERLALWWALGHDELTGLPNRRLLFALAPSLLRGAAGDSVVLLLDLNGFKQINDRYGHATGDAVLRAVAQRLSRGAGDNLVARLSGDEFVAILARTGSRSPGYWWRPEVTALSRAIAAPHVVDGRVLSVTASIGVTPGHPAVALEELLRRADLAMYRAKAAGAADAAWGTDLVDPGIGLADPGGTCATGAAADPPAVAGPDRSIAGRVVLELTVFPALHPGDPWRCAPGGATAGPPAPGATAGPRPDDAAGGGGSEPATGQLHQEHHHQEQHHHEQHHHEQRFSPGEPVWVFRHGAWRPGMIESASRRAVTVTYQYGTGPATAVDTMVLEQVRPRYDDSPVEPPARPGIAA